MFYSYLTGYELAPGEELDFGDGVPRQSQAARIYQRNQIPIGLFNCKAQAPPKDGHRTILQPGCGLCGELLEHSTPHWCQAKLAKDHKKYVAENEYYRSVIRKNLAAEREMRTDNEKREGITDLAAWGDWVWTTEHGYDTHGIDRASVQRAQTRIARLTVDQQRELRSVYVVRCEAVRQAVRAKRRAPGEPQPRVRQKLAPWTVAERAYLERRADS